MTQEPAAEQLGFCCTAKTERLCAVQEDRMRLGRARSLASSLTTVGPEEETFWALQGLSFMERCG